ncbi:hypothetical protein K439DRAFT_1616229 [Ramaria rubella]|nr:hypothetical protein K439DRAFT_1616229 [Ramaria rubella]
MVICLLHNSSDSDVIILFITNSESEDPGTKLTGMLIISQKGIFYWPLSPAVVDDGPGTPPTTSSIHESKTNDSEWDVKTLVPTCPNTPNITHPNMSYKADAVQVDSHPAH